jgi:hypothetical protein
VVAARRLSLALIASLAIHALPALPEFIGSLLAEEIELPPDMEDDPAALAPPPPELPHVPTPEEVVPASLFHLTIYEEPPPKKKPRKPKPVPAPVVPAPEPVPEPPPEEPPPAVAEEPPPEPLPEVPPDAADAVAEIEAAAADIPPVGDQPVADDDGEAYEAWKRKRGKDGTGRAGKKNDAPCPGPHPSVVELSAVSWRVDRPLVDYYATHLRELQKLGTVWTHKGKDGKPDGFRVVLSRCSILRQAGLKTGDIVNDVNGRRISTLLQAVAAYFVLRDDRHLVLNVTRRDQKLQLAYDIDPVDKKLSKKERKEQASAAGQLLEMAAEARRREKEARKAKKKD